MNFLYTTDLHGNIPMYETILATALDKEIKLIHLGADLLPKGSNLLGIQKDFIKKYLTQFYTRKPYFRKIGSLLDEVPFYKEGFEFKAYPFVTDYKFGLKTACKWDSKDWRCPEEYIHKPIDFTEQGESFVIPNPEAYFASKGTIEEDLKDISVSPKTIMAIHQPPANLNLDVCRSVVQNNKHWVWVSEKTRKVGSLAVFNWIKQEQPLLVLSGHIHENYHATKTWKKKLGNTIVIQPGQCFSVENRTRCVVIHISDREVDAVLLEIANK
jgi:Icc-related predicted phosphoesterase